MQAHYLRDDNSPILRNPLALSRGELADLCLSLDEKSAHAKSIIKYIHQLGVCDYAEMHDIKPALRDKLAKVSAWELPTIVEQQKAGDGTYKWLFRLIDGCLIETVLIPEKHRNTLCVSTQVGCALNCTFCATARQGFTRNLESAEIIAQLWIVNRWLHKTSGMKVDNVVFMGMGEPLLNFDAVVHSASLMNDDCAYGIPGRRVTVSTSGYVPGILRLQAVPNIALTVSLHAPSNELRNRLVPLNRKYPIEVLIDAVRQFLKSRRASSSITFAYVMLKDINDTLAYAVALAQLIKDLPAKVNLISFNDFEDSGFCGSEPEAFSKFRNILYDYGIVTTLRRPRGADISAACGQLVALQRNTIRNYENRSNTEGMTIWKKNI